MTTGEAHGFGPLVARVPHPLGRIFALITWMYFLMPAMFLLSFVLLAATGGVKWQGPVDWIVGLLAMALMFLLARWLARRAKGHTRLQAFYLYPQGYVLTSPSGRVARVVPWDEVTEVRIPPVTVATQIAFWSTRPRIICEIRHRRGRKVKFTEVVGQEVLAPLVIRLHAEAVEQV